MSHTMLSAFSARRRDELFGLGRGAPVDQHEPGALLRERLGDSAPNALGGAGHDYILVLESSHGFHSFRFFIPSV